MKAYIISNHLIIDIMEDIANTIKNISSRISETEKKRQNISNYIKTSNNHLNLITQVQEKTPECSIAGVDGGIITKSLQGMDLAIIKVGAVCFNYINGKIKDVNHKPSRFPDYNAYVFDSLDHEWRAKSNILRQKNEIEAAINILDDNPDMLLLDGSVVPHQAYKNDSDEYRQLIEKYKILYKTALEKNIKLVGVVEDSRSRIFCEMLKQVLSGKIDTSILDYTRDSTLLYSMLQKGERTITFNYSKDPGNHPTLSDLKEYGNDIHSLYLKTVPHDRPLRLDFLSKNPHDGEEIASILLSISSHHSSYGLPAPIIEADNISRLSEKDMDDFYSRIITLTGELPDVMKMRRDQRPL